MTASITEKPYNLRLTTDPVVQAALEIEQAKRRLESNKRQTLAEVATDILENWARQRTG